MTSAVSGLCPKCPGCVRVVVRVKSAPDLHMSGLSGLYMKKKKKSVGNGNTKHYNTYREMMGDLPGQPGHCRSGCIVCPDSTRTPTRTTRTP